MCVTRLPLPILVSVLGLATILTAAALDNSVPDAELLDRIRTALLGMGLAPTDLVDMRMAGRIQSDHNGVTHCYLQQTFRGLDIEGARMTVNLDRDGTILPPRLRFVTGLADQPATAAPPCTAERALGLAAAHLGLPPPPENPAVAARRQAPARTAVLDAGATSAEPIRAEQVYLPLEDGLRRVWKLTVHAPRGVEVWDVMVDAYDDQVRRVVDRVSHAAYRVYPFPSASPHDGIHTLVTDPADPVASPFGWHDVDGRAGAEYTTTRGNNAIVVDDRDANDTGGISPDGGSTLHFDVPRAPTTPQDDRSAAVNAFYWVNLCHDIFFHYGFDAQAGNFQHNLYLPGRPSGGNDPVQVDVQDGDGTNNAYMFTPIDGRRPRLTLMLWNGALDVEIVEPAAAADILVAGSAEFGPAPGAGVAGRVVLARDTADTTGPSPTDLCSAILNAAEVAGNIALIDRGTCLFVDKVLKAQNAGAIGAIIINNAGDEIIRMAGDDPSIVIPAVFVRESDGNRLKALLANGLQVVLRGDGTRDSAFANDVIIHEYGHGVSTRLTGGSSNSSCLTELQSNGMGEGWSDWWSLALTVKPGDSPQRTRGTGRYLTIDPAQPQGIRTYPYSVETGVNPLTYGDLIGLSADQEHAAGEIWCAALWELYWNLVAAHGFSPDLAPGPAGNQLALQLVLDGLKLQPCNPTFLEARDAILLADQLNNQSTNHCLLWNAFAKRGMGLRALDGGTAASNLVTEDFTVPESCRIPRLNLRHTTDTLTLTWTSVFDGTYRIQATHTLDDPQWTAVTDPLPSQGAVSSTPLPPSTPPTRYFRAVLTP